MSKPPPPMPLGVNHSSELDGWLREHPKQETGRETRPRKIADTECGRPVTAKTGPDPDGPCHDLVDVDDRKRRETFKFECGFCKRPIIVMSNIIKTEPVTGVEIGDVVQCDHCMTGWRIDAINPDMVNPGVKLQVSFFAGPMMMAAMGHT